MSLKDLSLPVVLGLAGVVLLMAGVLGKKFVFLQSRIPETAGKVRVAGVLVGSILILLGISTFTYQVRHAAGQELPDPPTSSDPPTTTSPTSGTTSRTTSTTTTTNSSKNYTSDSPASTTSKSSHTTTSRTTTTTKPFAGQVKPIGAEVFDQPYFTARKVGFLPGGSVAEIFCTTRGQMSRDPYNGYMTDLWDFVGTGYIPDVAVDTRTNAPTRGPCR
ncbi:hypothetical protein [Actinocrispum sp. NPDC049592]|uniref:hypothetical protein n=1 Tax=Actinocrispum sp. NPDC049592 TaxID=3154835 RepID=UPI003412C3AA